MATENRRVRRVWESVYGNAKAIESDSQNRRVECVTANSVLWFDVGRREG